MFSIKQFKKWLTNQSGTVAIAFALSLVPMSMMVGVALDYSRATQLNSNVTGSVDAALVSTASDILNDLELNLENEQEVVAKATALFEPYLFANIKNSAPPYYNGSTFTYNTETKELNVEVSAAYKTTLAKLTGVNEIKIGAKSSVQIERKTGGSLSMYLVLDRSGSMGWNFPTRMTSLKFAVNGMIDGMVSVDPENKFIRMGAVAYNHETFSQKSLRWNLSQVNSYVQDMFADGGTNSGGAVKKAYKQLKKDKEITEHFDKTEQEPKLVMVFMTDGNNNSGSSDVETLKYCNKAKDYGMVVYTVAFQAPANGQALLASCATNSAHYFQAEDSAALVKIFKKIGSNATANLFISK